ncbi:hypothetical protein SAMN05428985_103218 [Nocardioides sp. YR527]|uniref:hypothetical protein n=1 Tax=Nocardioides sp. YR527 TaxID=1881028 RepID=UPI000882066B|nr:hypothetical protein [Nocardioides sp. YR527]SDK25013.1 hypothetical protein SAMN05428985_103218 [Nocardioides sp. YR527]
MTPRRSLPHTIKLASIAWAGAVAAGVIESVLAVTRILGEGAMEPGDWLGLGIRVAVYAAAAALITGLVRGSRTARLALTGLLSVAGLASLVVPAALEIVGGSSVAAALGSDGGLLGTVFVTVRVIHVVLVIVATVAMYTPTANAYFRRPDSSSRPSRLPAAAGS